MESLELKLMIGKVGIKTVTVDIKKMPRNGDPEGTM